MVNRSLFIFALMTASLAAHAVVFTSISPTLIAVEERIELPRQFVSRNLELVDASMPFAFTIPGYRRDDEIELISEF